ncbi:MAG: EF-Tu/IF-2/RF-3 family GTPase, partial [Nanoarchaeota archaeon]
AYTDGSEEAVKELRKKAPIHQVILNAVVKHLPNPIVAQKYRIPKIWHGDDESQFGKDLASCNPKGKVGFVITKIVVDPLAGEICTGRLFSGTVSKGMTVYLLASHEVARIQQVYIFNGAKREVVEDVPAGNIIGIAGFKKGFAGETVAGDTDAEPFEQIKHLFEPVVTKAVEATKPSDLPKLIEVLKKVAKEDPSITIQINEETGEHLMSGMGELHLEIIENRIKTEKKLDINTSPPVVVFRETVTKPSREFEGKSPNKHNKFYFKVQPLSQAAKDLLKSGELPEGRIKKKNPQLWEKLVAAGFDAKEARKVKNIYKGNILIEDTRGQVHMGEVIELINDMFEDVMRAGPLAKEPSTGVMVTLTDMTLHEDSIHRGPAQVYPAVRGGIRSAILDGGAMLFEPVQILQFDAQTRFMGEISKLLSSKRGQMLDMDSNGEFTTIKGKLQVAEMFGLSNDIRSSTEGRASFSVVDQGFEKLPNELQQKIISQIKSRKGIVEEEPAE